MIEASKHRPRGYMSGMELCRAMKLPVLLLASKVGLGLDDFNPFYTSEITKLVEYDALYFASVPQTCFDPIVMSVGSTQVK